MKLTIKTIVAQDFRTVFEGFDRDLFMALAPPFPPFELEHFGGCKTGDEVRIRLGVGFLKQHWISDITDNAETEDEIYFIDQGRKLPAPLRYWRHKHRILRNNEQAVIRDEITYKTGLLILDWLIYPFMYGMFAYRRPIYKRFFGNN